MLLNSKKKSALLTAPNTQRSAVWLTQHAVGIHKQITPMDFVTLFDHLQAWRSWLQRGVLSCTGSRLRSPLLCRGWFSEGFPTRLLRRSSSLEESRRAFFRVRSGHRRCATLQRQQHAPTLFQQLNEFLICPKFDLNHNPSYYPNYLKQAVGC